MYKYLKRPLVDVNKKSYLTLIIVLMPLLNFLGGINVDIYAPSMPAIASFFNVTVLSVKNTIAATIAGWVFGALFFGILIDSIGRRKTLLFGVSLYVLVSAFGPWCDSIDQLMFVRFVQGFATVSVSIGTRAVIVDNITGPRYQTAIIYTSLGYGLGPIIGPFVGGILQHYFGWRANFYALFILSLFLLANIFLFVKESIPKKQRFIIKDLLQRYGAVLNNKKFIAGAFLLGLIQMQMLLYPTLGPFVVEGILHKSAFVYGNTALCVGAGYLAGNFLNRLLLQVLSIYQTSCIAYTLLLVAIALSFLFSLLFNLNLITVMLPITLINVSSGILFSNIMGTNLRLFPSHVGTALAIQMSLLALITAIGIFLANHIYISHLRMLAFIYLFIALPALFLFFYFYRELLTTKA